MKNLTSRVTRIVFAILLIFGTIFAAAFANIPNARVYAVEPDDPSQTTENTEPGNNGPGHTIEPNTDETAPGNNIEADPDDTDPGHTIEPDPDNPDDPGHTITPGDDTSNPDNPDADNTDQPTTCEDQVGALAWIVCPTTGVIAKFIDAIYNVVDGLSVVPPLSMEANSPIYLVWQYARSITNIVFVIFLLIVIYSQLTGFGLNNYGVKRILPRLIIAVVLVNLSFIICSLAVDLSNIIGSNLREFFTGIQEHVIANSEVNEVANLPVGEIITSIISGVGIASIAIGATGGGAALFWMLIPVLVGAVIAIVSGLLTIAARQALVALLVMISPLAFVAYLLPNTEKWFTKWKTLLFQMLIFYPMFSFLFGASQLAGWALINSAKDGFGLILGIAVQIFPLVFSWSLMKMSGTILGTINTGLRKLAAPAERGIAGWSLSHKELNRQRYLANSMMPGAKLRRYLDYRRELRELDTKNSIEIRHGKAHERALITASSSTGTDKDGNDTWEKRANRYTRNAKNAALYETRVGVATAAYKNTLSAYGGHFAGSGASRLADAHGEAYLNAMKQQFLAANEAQSDQDYLLGRYLGAMNNSNTNPYQYNRLIKGAAGSLGHTGVSSIMGQVIQGNAAIEERRRKEGRIMSTKFGMEKHKQQLRAMEFDWKNIDDNGYAYDDDGNRLEDDEYNLLPHVTPEMREKYRYPFYIAVHKTTGNEITKAEYDALSEKERTQYRKVKYFDLTDDAGKPVNRIFEDDAGYIKELLIDDIAIADPIIRRYITEIGVAKNDKERDGILRKYHSTIRSAMEKAGANTHGAGITGLLLSAVNAGYVRSMSDYFYILAQSYAVAAKPGNFHKNDKFFIEEADKLSRAATDPEVFDKLFEHDKIMGIVNNNGIPIDGAELATDENGNQFWKTIDYRELEKMSDTERVIEAKKNFIKHIQLPKTLTSLVGFVGRRMNQEAQASLKPGALPAMTKMLEHLKQIGNDNLNPEIPFEQRPDGNKNIFSTPNGDDLYREVIQTQQQLKQLYNLGDDYQPIQPSSSSHSSPASVSGRYDSTFAQLTREAEANRRYEAENDPDTVIRTIEECFIDAKTHHSVDRLCSDILGYFDEIACLRPYYSLCQEIVERITGIPNPDRSNFIQQITDPYSAFEEGQIDALYPEIMDLVYTAVRSN